MHAVCSGVISFGLVSIPVKVYLATKEWTPDFHYIHSKCGKRPAWIPRCAHCQTDVPRDELVRGHEVAREDYVEFTQQEYDEVAGPERPGVLDVLEVVSPSEIDPLYVGKPYWVVPTGAHAHAFSLLRDGLATTQKVALAKLKIRRRTYVTMLRPNGLLLTMALMRFADEVIGAEHFPMPDAPPASEREQQAARDLLTHLATPFDPTRHANEYRKRVQAAVDRKLEAGAQRNGVSNGVSESRPAPVFDLTTLLARSLTETPKPGLKKAPQKPAKPRKAKKAER
jgi:DNA end-binding protein Ku